MKKILLLILCIIGTQNLVAQLEDFTFEDIDGTSHHLYQYLENDKLVVLEFFFTDCGFCTNFAPTLQSIYEDIGENQEDVIILSMEVQNANNEEIMDWKESAGSSIPVCGGDGPWNYWAAHIYPLLQGNFEQIVVLSPTDDGHEIVFSGTRLGLNGTEQDLIDAIEQYRTGGTNTVVEEVTNFDWNITPNPASQKVILDIQMVDTASPLLVHLYDLTGKLVQTQMIAYPVAQSRVELDLTGLAVGSYLVELVQDGKKERKTVVVR